MSTYKFNNDYEKIYYFIWKNRDKYNYFFNNHPHENGWDKLFDYISTNLFNDMDCNCVDWQEMVEFYYPIFERYEKKPSNNFLKLQQWYKTRLEYDKVKCIGNDF